MTSKHININMGAKYKKENTNNSIIYTKCRGYITLYNTYRLWYCKWHIEMIINHIIINMGAKYKKENTNNSIIYTNVEVILHYITLTPYYIANDT